jgi:hypothetical protein
LNGPHMVQEVVLERHLVPSKARLLLDENRDLYVHKVSRFCQSVVHSKVIMEIGIWLHLSSFQVGLLAVSIAGNGDYGNRKFGPNVGILAFF